MSEKRIQNLVNEKVTKVLNNVLKKLESSVFRELTFTVDLKELYAGLESGQNINRDIGAKISKKMHGWVENKMDRHIYIFESDRQTIKDIVKAVEAFREINDNLPKEQKVGITNVNEGVQSETCLYVGKSKEDLAGRIKEHLRKPSKETYAMRLFDVLKDSKDVSRELKITMLSICGINDITHNLIEAVIAAELKPALGSHEDIEN